jgi:hypothetical protein
VPTSELCSLFAWLHLCWSNPGKTLAR